VLPVSLTRDWNLITRPVFQLYNIVPHETSPGHFETTTGLGDTILLELFSPANSGKWILGAGRPSSSRRRRPFRFRWLKFNIAWGIVSGFIGLHVLLIFLIGIRFVTPYSKPMAPRSETGGRREESPAGGIRWHDRSHTSLS
jgi:hypothetical protein